jgi:alpha-galactosidase
MPAIARVGCAWLLVVATAHAVVPLDLPRPDATPGNPAKPVKVYILAGQSNMVGMGDISGAQPLYPSIYLSADPAIIPGVMPVGAERHPEGYWKGVSAVAAHGIHESAAADAPVGAIVSLYAGAFDPRADYAALQPVKTARVPLGTVAASLPALDGPHTAVARAWIDVPATGTYTLHPGFGDSTHAVAAIDGQEVYRREPGGKPVVTKLNLEAGKRYPLTVTFFKSGSAALWMEQVDIPGRGDLVTLVKQEGKFPYLLDAQGAWSVRNDVTFQEARVAKGGKSAALSVLAHGGNTIGPEVGFGSVMGTFHDEPVLLIKTAMGNRSLAWDFRPPSSGTTGQPGAAEWEGLEYRLMVQGVRDTLGRIAEVVPGYQGQGYEIAGFAWFQGHKDRDATKQEYERHLVNLIQDLRKEFDVPKMPAVVATVGFDGYRLASGPWHGVWEAQMAVGDPKQHPEFAGTVASVDTRDFWRELSESPRSQDYHYHRNPETYLLVGEALGRAMVRLQGGEAEAIPKSDREARVKAEIAAAAARPAATPDQLAAHAAVLKPMILDGALARFVADPRNGPLLQAALAGQRPEKPSPLLADALDTAVLYYQAAGIHDYDWQPYGPDMKGAAWDYVGIDLPPSEAAADPKAKPPAVVEIPAPPGMADWFAADFDARKAGWKTGPAPFGESNASFVFPEWAESMRANRKPKTPCDHDVLFLRQRFAIPKLAAGHRYRIRIAGSPHNNMGEGYSIHANGRLVAATTEGVLAWRRQGGIPRGAHVFADLRDAFPGGETTIAVSSFPMIPQPSADRFIPAGPALTVWMEGMKVPPIE